MAAEAEHKAAQLQQPQENGALSLVDELKKFDEWSSATVFDAEGNVVATTSKDLDVKEVKALLKKFDDRDQTVASGVRFFNRHFEVQRFYQDYIYGRLEEAREKEGFCLHRTNSKNKKTLFTIITYLAPTTSARAIPQLREFARKNLEPL